MIPAAKLERMLDRFAAVEAQMSSGVAGDDFVKLSKEYAELEPVAKAARSYRVTQEHLAQATVMASDAAQDAEMRELAEMEIGTLKDELAALEHELLLALIPKDAADNSSAIVEIRAGTGGDEAALFAADLMGMYTRYCQLQGWKVEVMELSESDLGGVREVVMNVDGAGVFAKLKFESGVHRVQRVPVTEAGGRIHTSAATVAVLPQPEDVDIKIDEKDLRIDVFRSSGAGGQHVNKTESAVRVTHLPTGLAVAQQTERSQFKNKANAMRLLKARLYEMERERVDSARAAERKGQVGSGDRSERIRTYNFPQGRVTDHRINLTLYKLDRIITGDDLGDVITALVTEDQAGKLAELESEV